MELIVRHGEREEDIHLEARDDGTYQVRVGRSDGGRTYQIDLVEAGRLTSLRLLGESEGRQFEVATRRIDRRSRGAAATYEVSSHRGVDRVEITDPLTRLAEEAAGEGSGATTVSAYMPGRVVEVLVAEGDSVSRGQGIVVLEAMKMKNEIQAETDGRVARLYVSEGEAVEGGDPLFEIDETD
ncbi:MAG: acetyl-CoA carboxylase biotin carboxyl carrier protein subunit [Thermoanaerobaculia bacterium]|nr:acetyl-CoA carboxylase biotin carboxyl carrier protein subunit [Thermoanaerobaculia bacterium]